MKKYQWMKDLAVTLAVYILVSPIVVGFFKLPPNGFLDCECASGIAVMLVALPVVLVILGKSDAV